MTYEKIDVWAKTQTGEVHKVLHGITVNNTAYILTKHDKAQARLMHKAVGTGGTYVALCDENGGCESMTLDEYKEAKEK